MTVQTSDKVEVFDDGGMDGIRQTGMGFLLSGVWAVSTHDSASPRNWEFNVRRLKASKGLWREDHTFVSYNKYEFVMCIINSLPL